MIPRGSRGHTGPAASHVANKPPVSAGKYAAQLQSTQHQRRQVDTFTHGSKYTSAYDMQRTCLVARDGVHMIVALESAGRPAGCTARLLLSAAQHMHACLALP